jgi:predicted metallo-beta-lactamase superfamily hydrolase
MRAEMPDTMRQLRQMRENEAINLWFRHEAERDPGFRDIMEQLAKRNQRGGAPS